MKKYFSFFIGLIIAYILGNIIPWKVFVPNIDWTKKISSGEYFYYCITVIQAIGTIGAVLVALFSDAIKSYLRKPALEFRLHKENVSEVLDENKTNIKAKAYHGAIDIFNNGNSNAEDCELHVESIIFKGHGMTCGTELLSGDYPLSWNEDDKKTYIPVRGKKSFSILTILPPISQSTPGGQAQTLPASMSIGTFETPAEFNGGEWTVSISLYSPCLGKPHKLSLIIVWDGSWENRETEMKKKIRLTLEEL